MSQLPVLSGKEIIQLLKSIGFSEVSCKGSHVKLKGFRDGEKRIVIVPLHDELAFGTLRSILRQAGLTVKDLRNLI
ncbi:MAG TPA: addiction module toxin, HicA family [Syntrophomonadaceae bacterium]|nr:addiction module toxin, HicA family [Syntrophomonadaceae bacterium]